MGKAATRKTVLATNSMRGKHDLENGAVLSVRPDSVPVLPIMLSTLELSTNAAPVVHKVCAIVVFGFCRCAAAILTYAPSSLIVAWLAA